MSFFAVILTSLSCSMIQPTSVWPVFTPSTTTTPTPSPSSCTTKWIIALSRGGGGILDPAPARVNYMSWMNPPILRGMQEAPLYKEVKQSLTRGLAGGEWRPGEALPSESALAERF